MRPVLTSLLLLASPAFAEVRSATDIGFATEHKGTVDVTPDRVFAALTTPGAWWSPEHSYSGDARNMTLDATPGGCFCEALPKSGGRVEHGRVVYIVPGKALRLAAALGPLQAEGVAGALTWTIAPGEQGGTTITQSYVVGGYMRAGPRVLAPMVDSVMGEQFARLLAYAGRQK